MASVVFLFLFSEHFAQLEVIHREKCPLRFLDFEEFSI